MGAVWSTAVCGWYDFDVLMWCVTLPFVDDSYCKLLLILVPSGPSTLLLLSVARQAHVDEGSVPGFLIVAYLCSPLMAFA